MENLHINTAFQTEETLCRHDDAVGTEKMEFIKFSVNTGAWIQMYLFAFKPLDILEENGENWKQNIKIISSFLSNILLVFTF